MESLHGLGYRPTLVLRPRHLGRVWRALGFRPNRKEGGEHSTYHYRGELGIESLEPECQSPLVPQEKFEVIAGMGFILELVSKELGEVYDQLSED